MIFCGLCLLLLATPAFAAGITSWAPDTTRREARVLEPMVETPIWYGLTYSLGSRYEQALNGFGRAPQQLSVISTGATWPWRSRLQGWSEFAYMVRTLYDERTYHPYWDPSLTFVQGIETTFDMFTIRGGVEYRFGAKGRPWSTAGAGLGMGFALGNEPAAATDVLARVTYFSYPSRHTRLGLMLAAGPTWIAAPQSAYRFGVGSSGGNGTRTHYEVGLRIESRLRFPVANAD